MVLRLTLTLIFILSTGLEAYAQSRAAVQRGVVQLDSGGLDALVFLSGDWAVARRAHFRCDSISK